MADSVALEVVMKKKLIVFTFIVACFTMSATSHSATIKNQKDIDAISLQVLSEAKNLQSGINDLIVANKTEEAVSSFNSITDSFSFSKLMLNVSCSKNIEKKCINRALEIENIINNIFDDHIKRIDSYDDLPPNHEDMVTNYIKNYMFDPDAAKFKDFSPQKGYQIKPGGKIGWRITGLLNGKNKYGGYVGYKPFECFIVGNKIDECSIDGDTLKK